jgi:rod shape-determining protein MreC
VAASRRPSRPRYVIAVLILAALTLVTLDARGAGGLSKIRNKVDDAFAPLQRGTHDALRPIGNFLTGAFEYGSLRSENQRLRSEIAGLQNQSLQASEDEASAKAVLGLSNLPFVGDIPHITVQVIDIGPSNFEDTVEVNKGTDDGLEVGEPVVAAAGLVGSVIQAGATTATVELLSDPDFVAGVKLQGGNVGSVQGTGRDRPLQVSVVVLPSVKSPKMTVGETVYTSGFDTEKFPPNIPVGKVLSVTSPPPPDEPNITLAPVVNLDQLDYLDVLIWTSPTP